MARILTRTINNFKKQVNDSGSGAERDVSFWAPDLSFIKSNESYFYAGLYATNNYNATANPSGPMEVFRKHDSNGHPCLKAPTGLTTIWECRGNDQPSNLGIYNPIAPAGYIALGTIAVPDFNKNPDLKDYPNLMCVRKNLCQVVTLTGANEVWRDAGSGVSTNVIVWQLPYSKICFASAFGLGNGYPSSVLAYDIIPAF